jgi:hypothetical protein
MCNALVGRIPPQWLVWSFTGDFAPIRAEVAGYAASLVRTLSPVPPPQAPAHALSAAQDAYMQVLRVMAHGAWARFTHLFFR